jgi:hypothetical protein
MIRRWIAIIMTGLLLAGLAGCSVDTELSGTPVPNSRPDTRITGQPPTLLEAGFLVQFNWTGSDPDGRVVGYQWKISDNGVDGISPRDTMTVDPLTGAELHPWFYTESNDSLFYVLADQAGFPNDLVPDDPDSEDDEAINDSARSFRTHTLWIRAVDDKGAVDPSPAQMSFTSTTLVPLGWGVYPSLSNVAKPVPTTVTLNYEGLDPDFDLRVPSRVRFLWRPAVAEDGTQIITKFRYENYYDELIDFNDPDWTGWVSYGTTEADRRISFPDQTPGEYFLFAVQVQDTAGYQREVLNLEISEPGRFRPGVNVSELYLGTTSTSTGDDIAAGQPLNFSWSASAAHYNGTVVSYRHGWDLQDIDDANDPGWSVPPGLSEQNRYAEVNSFQEGEHRFFLRVVDDSGNVAKFSWALRVIPNIDREYQYPLMLLDQTVDAQTNQWPGQGGSPAYDKQEFRNAYWRFLEGQGGVQNFSWEEDRWDHTEQVNYADMVWYKAVLMYARSNSSQLLFSEFRPVNGVDKFVWLAPYQQQGGNLFMVGAQSMESFLEVDNYMVPIIFDTSETDYVIAGESFVVGFGQKEQPDGTFVDRGPLQYGFLTAGIAALDWSVPLNKYIYGRRTLANEDRKSLCAGIKAVALDPEFKANHLIGPGVIPDTIGTNRDIDWRDFQTPEADSLNMAFPFAGDEFVDYNISSRSTPINLQECGGAEGEGGPNGYCIEPMFKGIARFDWLRERKWDEGFDGSEEGTNPWPYSHYGNTRLDEICGVMALTSYVGPDGTVIPKASARTNGLTYGFMSYKNIEDKPGGAPDVYWGFDPYRFNHEQSQKAIIWVLENTFGLDINQ